jgi:hypothetical protein
MLGQAQFHPRRNAVRDRAVAFAGIIAARELDDLLTKVRRVLEWRGDRVGDDVVYETGTHGSRKAEKADLDRAWPAAQHRRAAIVRVAGEVDGNVDLLCPQQFLDLPVSHAADVVEMFKRRYDPAAHGTAVVMAEGDAHDLEARPVM